MASLLYNLVFFIQSMNWSVLCILCGVFFLSYLIKLVPRLSFSNALVFSLVKSLMGKPVNTPLLWDFDEPVGPQGCGTKALLYLCRQKLTSFCLGSLAPMSIGLRPSIFRHILTHFPSTSLEHFRLSMDMQIWRLSTRSDLPTGWQTSQSSSVSVTWEKMDKKSFRGLH